MKDINELQFLLTDIIQGDTDLLARPEFRYFTTETIQTALNYLLNNKNLSDKDKAYLVGNSWRINYRGKPPTPTNFITDKYIGRSAVHTYDRVKVAFEEFLDPSKPYRNAILFPHIGFGKSYLATLINLYIGTHISLMRNPYKYFGLNPATILTQLLMQFLWIIFNLIRVVLLILLLFLMEPVMDLFIPILSLPFAASCAASSMR